MKCVICLLKKKIQSHVQPFQVTSSIEQCSRQWQEVTTFISVWPIWFGIERGFGGWGQWGDNGLTESMIRPFWFYKSFNSSFFLGSDYISLFWVISQIISLYINMLANMFCCALTNYQYDTETKNPAKKNIVYEF